MDFSPETLRARFHELTAQHDEIRAKSDPLRAKRDALSQKHALEEKALNDRIKEVEAGLFEIEQERAALARALGGKTSG